MSSLPAPTSKDLPEAPPLRRMLGPGIILAGLSIGSGEFVLWPRLTLEWGFAVFWAAWIGVLIQFFLNMEIGRYTLATGESAVLGFSRLTRVAGPVFLVCCSLPWIWPGWATGAGTILAWEIGGTPIAWAVGGLVTCGLVLSLGPVVYRTVETLMVVLVSAIFVALCFLAIQVVRPDAVAELFRGAARIGHLPQGIDNAAFLGALAFAGAGGALNLAHSNYVRDKGYGMGHWVGRITSPLTGREEGASDAVYAFPDTQANRARWRTWWRRTNAEHALTFLLLCLVSIALLALIAYSLLEPGAEVGAGLGFIREEGRELGERYGALAEHAFFGAGVAMLLSTELVLLDAVTRVVADLVHSYSAPRTPKWSLSRLYFVILWSFIALGVGILAIGMDEPLTLIVLSASLNAVVMFLYSGMLLWLNLSSFRAPVRPSIARVLALVAAFAFFGYFSAITIADRLGF